MSIDPIVLRDAIVLGLFVAAYIVLLFWVIAALSPKPKLIRTVGCMLAVMWVGFWVWLIAVRPVHTAGSVRPTEMVVREIDPATPQDRVPLPGPKPKL